MLVSTQMITGFNTDVPFDGHVYHVQTEDRGKDNPILESLVYVGGTIVAKKRTPYPLPLNGDADYQQLASQLKRQHQVIIAAIKAGRIDDLIRHSLKQKPEEELAAMPAVDRGQTPQAADVLDIDHNLRRHKAAEKPATRLEADASASLATPAPRSSGRSSGRNSDALKAGNRVSTSRGDTAGLNLDQVLEDYAKNGQAKLDVRVLTPETFVAGRGIGLRVQVNDGSKADLGATVTVKIIGTAFKPQVFIGRVGRDGVANFSITLPSFSTGTAAIVIEAQSNVGRGELKKLIRRA